MGTPDFAVTSLQTMIDHGYVPVAVVTAPDKAAGRGLKMQASPIKKVALDYGLTLFQPDDLRDESFTKSIKELRADLIVVVAFRKLPQSLLEIPGLQAINLHASLLPQYRGAAPINWAVINGETESGVTTFMLDQRIDTGKILGREKVPVHDDMTAGELHDLLMQRGAHLLLDTIQSIEKNDYQELDQSLFENEFSEIKKAPKIYRAHCSIDWKLPVLNVKNIVRGLYPYPGAFTDIFSPEGVPYTIKILSVTVEQALDLSKPGTIQTDTKSMIRICAGDGYVNIRQVQLAGKRIMSVSEFLRGFKLSNDWWAGNTGLHASETP